MSTPTSTESSKGAALLSLLMATPVVQPDPNMGNRLLDVACVHVNTLLLDHRDNGSDRLRLALLNGTQLHNPDEDSHVLWMALGIAVNDPNRTELEFTSAEKEMARSLSTKVRSLLAKQHRGEKKIETRKIHDTLQHLG